jgi:hypothetical protein
MVHIINNDDYLMINNDAWTIKIGKNKYVYKLHIINNNQEIIIDDKIIIFTFELNPKYYINFNLTKHGINFLSGYNINNLNEHIKLSISQLQQFGISYTNSKIECSEDNYCLIKYNTNIIKKIKQNINNFFNNKIKLSYNEFNKILKDYDININISYPIILNNDNININIINLFS